ncbi:MAG TPA: glucose-1-phosphate cytidylyltransferase, partial [Ktedonobacterales bacterium]|nr:glucose-1-phosphate cytidylyltransferase [Ktedonobacterales bacterium]
RLAEETEVRPKPMVEIGGRPILWHIMKHYAQHGFNEFFIALGYKGDVIKRFFLDYYGLSSSMTVNLQSGKVEVIDSHPEDWTVHLMDTGMYTNTGGRVKHLEPWLKNEPFLLTYGDGVSNIDLDALLAAHRSHCCVATVSAVRPPARFGGLVFDGDWISEFTEKPQIGEGWINGGFFVFEPAVLSYIASDDTSLEADVLEQLARERQLTAYRHDGFWQCMDTLRDKRLLESLWQSGNPPWQTWR